MDRQPAQGYIASFLKNNIYWKINLKQYKYWTNFMIFTEMKQKYIILLNTLFQNELVQFCASIRKRILINNT